MSTRNKLENKKLRRLERALRKGRVPTHINLIEWLMDRRYADTVGGARKLLLEGKVKYESHPLGKRIIERKDGTKVEVFEPLVSSLVRDSLVVTQTT